MKCQRCPVTLPNSRTALNWKHIDCRQKVETATFIWDSSYTVAIRFYDVSCYNTFKRPVKECDLDVRIWPILPENLNVLARGGRLGKRVVERDYLDRHSDPKVFACSIANEDKGLDMSGKQFGKSRWRQATLNVLFCYVWQPIIFKEVLKLRR